MLLLFYFLIFGYILSTNDLKISNLIGFGKVLAYETSGYGSAQYMDVTIPLVDSYGCFQNNTESSSNWINFGTEHTFGNRRFIKITRAMITSGSYTWTKDNTYTFRITLSLNPKDYQNFKNNSNLRWRIEGSTSTNSSGLSSANIVANSSIVTYGNYDNNNYWIYYDITFTPAQNLKLIWIQFDWSGSAQVGNNSCVGNSHPRALPGYNFVDFQWYRIDYIRYVPTNNWENVNQSINSQTTIIENNFNQTNENINKINDYINDDSIDDNHISSGMHDLPQTTSLTPFADFLNLPLNWIQNFMDSSNSCHDLIIPLPFVNKNLTLPCMSGFWNKLGPLASLIDLVWIAVIGSRIFRMFYRLTIDVIDLDPNSFNHLSKLKEWEL